jgi:hypothetical protein
MRNKPRGSAGRTRCRTATRKITNYNWSTRQERPSEVARAAPSDLTIRSRVAGSTLLHFACSAANPPRLAVRNRWLRKSGLRASVMCNQTLRMEEE